MIKLVFSNKIPVVSALVLNSLGGRVKGESEQVRTGMPEGDWDGQMGNCGSGHRVSGDWGAGPSRLMDLPTF